MLEALYLTLNFIMRYFRDTPDRLLLFSVYQKQIISKYVTSKLP